MKLKKIAVIPCFLCVAAIFVPVLSGCSVFQRYEIPSKDSVIKSPDIIKDGTLTVGVSKNNLPLSASTDNGFQGIDCDIAAAIANELGLNVEYIEIEKSASDFLNKEKIDIMMGANSTNVDSNVSLSNRYLTTAPVLFSLKQNERDIDSSSSVKTACQKGSGAASA
ncbi:MAG: transporter substrate-binding domain-containing protein, partial [Eggerthellaceae bacterium]|nr:transporter substrate-binding domain-containing protein [Eggerthellaceae bacterium]